MKIKQKLTLVVLTMLFQVSCGDWMELVPPQGLIREEFWKAKEDVEAVIMGAYETFATMDEMLFKFGEIRGDLVKGDINQSLDEQKIMESNIYPDNSMCNWFKFYQVINYCNEVIKYAPEVQGIDNTFSDYQLYGFISEAYFLRSLSYFYLVRIFRDVPLVLEPTINDGTNVYLPKTSGDEVLEHIVLDLEEVRNYATIDGYQTLAEVRGRATKPAIDALLADISLWNFDYEACIRHVQNIEATAKYVLMPSARWFEIFYPGNSLEGIFEFQFNTSLNQTNSMFDLTQRNGYNYDPSDRSLELFGKKYTRELYRGEDASIKKYSESDFIIWKYVGRAPDGETARSGIDQSSCNWIVYRYADVLLMKAEALSQLGRFPEALQIINEIRDRADVPPLSLPNSPTSYEDAILDERALELAFEGKRWFDLLRMGRRNDYSRKGKLIEIIVRNVPSTQKRILATKLTNPLGWYMPIYENELERNKNLVQNPYYNF
ncbi:MAG TPA: RagB/SusD family nutrient uptake outer membrane protein [Bacteroidales bacterium]|nr:RagB/SusD family nutrient uptake outer membrane protein [Bacteroidales bacterium]